MKKEKKQYINYPKVPYTPPKTSSILIRLIEEKGRYYKTKKDRRDDVISYLPLNCALYTQDFKVKKLKNSNVGFHKYLIKDFKLKIEYVVTIAHIPNVPKNSINRLIKQLKSLSSVVRLKRFLENEDGDLVCYVPLNSFNEFDDE